MQKTIKLLKLTELFPYKRLKEKTKDKWIYDNKFKIAFKSEEDRQEFVNHIRKAEEDIKEGRVFTQKEMNKYYKEQFGITI